MSGGGVMTQSEAADFAMPIGKYKGLTISEIDEDEDDRAYLIWLRNVRAEDDDHEPDDLDEALEAFLKGE
jgi:hypothetical protein